MKHPVDVHVGMRVRQCRWLLGVTQQQLAQKVGIKFQQIQKYESGANRISASRLWAIASALNVSIAYFFEGLNGEASEFGERGPVKVYDAAAEREAIELIRAHATIPPEQRRRLIDLARVLGDVA